jgi:hypothetical protein
MKMEKNSKNSYSTHVLLSFLALFSSSFLFTPCSMAFRTGTPVNSSIALSFDSLFPLSWYQKGLESLLYVWQVLVQAYENDSALPFDAMLSKLALVQFAINRMIRGGDVVLPEDIEYLKVVVSKIQGVVGMIVVTPQTTDVVDCMKEMLLSIQKQIPCL